MLSQLDTPKRRRRILATFAVAAATLLASVPLSAPTAEAAGRSGTGFKLGELPTPHAPIGRSMKGKLNLVEANLPNRAGPQQFAASMRTLTAENPDFITLNEVSGRSMETLRATAPAYVGYRDPVRDTSQGGMQSMNNVVMWRADKWRLLDGGRVKLVDDDRGYSMGRPFTWDRYATWTILKRRDGAILSVISTHMMTNPEKFPRQHGNPPLTRVQQYAQGMDILVRLVQLLAGHGPVILGGDMNSHLSQGSWTAPAKALEAGYPYAKNQGVLYLFHHSRITEVSSHQVRVASDHPALVARLALNGHGPS